MPLTHQPLGTCRNQRRSLRSQTPPRDPTGSRRPLQFHTALTQPRDFPCMSKSSPAQPCLATAHDTSRCLTMPHGYSIRSATFHPIHSPGGSLVAELGMQPPKRTCVIHLSPSPSLCREGGVPELREGRQTPREREMRESRPLCSSI